MTNSAWVPSRLASRPVPPLWRRWDLLSSQKCMLVTESASPSDQAFQPSDEARWKWTNDKGPDCPAQPQLVAVARPQVGKAIHVMHSMASWGLAAWSFAMASRGFRIALGSCSFG